MLAASAGHVGVVEELLGAGADVGRVTRQAWTAGMFAAFNGHDAVVKILAGKGTVGLRGDGGGKLVLAAQEGHVGVVKVLLDGRRGEGSNVESRGWYGSALVAVT